MKELIALPIELIFEFIGDFILQPLLDMALDSCPPLMIFIVAFLCIISGNGCAMIVGVMILIPVGIIAMIIWFLL